MPTQIHHRKKRILEMRVSAMTNDLLIRPGTLDDIPRAEELYRLARAGLKASGIDQWQGVYPDGSDFAADVRAGIAIAAEKDGAVIAVAACCIGHDPTYDKIYDGQWLTHNRTYGIIHRIAVDPMVRANGTASQIIAHLKTLCLQEGIGSMRCDTHRDNRIMQHTLEKNGYQKCGIILVEDGTQRLAYEKCL